MTGVGRASRLNWWLTAFTKVEAGSGNCWQENKTKTQAASNFHKGGEERDIVMIVIVFTKYSPMPLFQFMLITCHVSPLWWILPNTLGGQNLCTKCWWEDKEEEQLCKDLQNISKPSAVLKSFVKGVNQHKSEWWSQKRENCPGSAWTRLKMPI